MTRFIGTALALIAFAGMALTCAGAQTPEQAYYAARDAAVARVKALNHPVGPTGPTPQEAIDEDTRSLAALEQQMRAIVGPVTIKGMTGNGAINLDTPPSRRMGLLSHMRGGVQAAARLMSGLLVSP